MTDDATMILFDRPKIEQLRAAHASATAEGRLHLVFQGRHWPTAYAMLVLTALDTQKMITHALETYEGEPCIVARDESQFVREVYRLVDYPNATETPQQMVDRLNASVARDFTVCEPTADTVATVVRFWKAVKISTGFGEI